MSKKDGKLFRDIFFNKKAFAVVQKYLEGNVYDFYYPPVARE